MSKYLYGMHEPCPSDVMPQGWILFLAEVGHSNDEHPGMDFTPWADAGYGIICRIQHAWGTGGCLPLPGDLEGYLQRVETLTRNSQGCDKWIIGNEPNHSTEWPNGEPLIPEYVAGVYDACRAIIDGEVLLPPIGPWNDEIGYGWVEYFVRMINACQDVDGFALHTYSRGSHPASITSEDKMEPPYQHLYSGFRTYRDWMAAIPRQYRDRPTYITETDQNDAWLDEPNTWVQAAYAEINDWNQDPDHQAIRAVILYRWPKYDPYFIVGKGHVIDDFRRAQSHVYTWQNEEEPPVEKDWTATYSNHCEDYHEAGEHPPITVLDGWVVNWADESARPEMTFKFDPQVEVCPWDKPRSGVGFLPYATFNWWMHTEAPISIAAGIRTKLEVALMVVAHGISGDAGKIGDCGMVVGIGGPGVTDINSADILWSDWHTVRDPTQPGANLKEYEWITAETPEIIPTVGQASLWIRCVANVAADISAGHFDLIRVMQVTDAPPVDPPVEPPITDGTLKDHLDAIQAALDATYAYVDGAAVQALVV